MTREARGFVIKSTREFADWLTALGDSKLATNVRARLVRMSLGSFGDWRAIEGALFELRIHLGAGHRIYCARRGNVVILCLVAGSKKSQKRDISRAQAMLARLDVEEG